MLKRMLLGAGAAALMSGAVQAADIIEPAAYDWTGPYIGLQGGYAWGENDVEVDAGTTGLAIEELRSEPVTLFPADDGSIDMDGWVGGLHLGYLWQHDSIVFGIEGDGEFADIDGDTDVFRGEGDELPLGSLEQEIDWLASLRLRAGFAMDRALIYATGGLAVGGVKFRTDLDGTDNESESETAWGWTIGGGLDYAFTDDLSARIEYRYTDLGDIDVEIGRRVSFEADTTFHAVRAGLSWRFGNM